MQPVLTIALNVGADGCPLKALLKSLPDMTEVYAEPGLTVLRVAPGVLLELHSTGSCMPAHGRGESTVLLSLRVGDLKSTVDLLTSKGATVLLAADAEKDGLCLSHVQLADGHVLGLFEEK
jgi:hypothetical protein